MTQERCRFISQSYAEEVLKVWHALTNKPDFASIGRLLIYTHGLLLDLTDMVEQRYETQRIEEHVESIFFFIQIFSFCLDLISNLYYYALPDDPDVALVNAEFAGKDELNRFLAIAAVKIGKMLEFTDEQVAEDSGAAMSRLRTSRTFDHLAPAFQKALVTEQALVRQDLLEAPELLA